MNIGGDKTLEVSGMHHHSKYIYILVSFTSESQIQFKTMLVHFTAYNPCFDFFLSGIHNNLEK